MGYKHGFTHHRYIGNGSKAYAAGFKDGLHDRIVIDGWRGLVGPEAAPRPSVDRPGILPGRPRTPADGFLGRERPTTCGAPEGS
jgi:hypothetical protein